MARVVVDVMLKPEILDPQGQAIVGALPSLGLEGVTGIRQGKHFVVDLVGDLDDSARELVHRLAATLLSNPVIEDYLVRVES